MLEYDFCYISLLFSFSACFQKSVASQKEAVNICDLLQPLALSNTFTAFVLFALVLDIYYFSIWKILQFLYNTFYKI